MIQGTQCINTDCLYLSCQDIVNCSVCGSRLIIDGRFKPIEIVSNAQNPWASEASQTFEAIELGSNRRVILWVVNSDDPNIATPLLEAVYALRQIHGLNVQSDIMRLIEHNAYFRWRILPDGPLAHCMVTKKVEGTPLDRWIEKNAPIDQKLAISWLEQLIISASKLHEQGLLHRDIKPSNIIVKDNIQLVLVDLGAVCFIDPSESMNTAIRQGNSKYPTVGSSGFTSPEQSEGKPIPVSDFFSIGRTIINLVTGLHPSDLPYSKTDTQRLEWREQAPQVTDSFAAYIDTLQHPNWHFRPSNPERIVEYISDHTVFDDSIAPISKKPTFKTKFLQGIVLLLMGLSITGAAVQAVTIIREQREIISLFSESEQLLESGDYQAAIQVLEEAISAVADPEIIAFLRSNLGLAYAEIGNRQAAIENFELALQIEQNPVTYYSLGNILEASDLSLAADKYKAAIATSEAGSPVQIRALNNLVRIYMLSDQLPQAAAILKLINVTEIENSLTRATVLKNLGWLLKEQGKTNQALDALNQSIEADPTLPDAYCLLALINGNENDRVTCLSLNSPIDKPELRQWKAEILARE